MVTSALKPLTVITALTSWRVDLPTTLLVGVVLLAYGWAWRRSHLPVGRFAVFGTVGCAVWWISADSAIGVYADELFWIRALQFVLLPMVVPFGLALGTPLTAVIGALPNHHRARAEKILGGRTIRILTHPATMSAALLVTPWLIYLTGWYRAVLTDDAIDWCTRLLLVVIGWLYFTTRLQIDRVPGRFGPGLSVLIATVESIGDGVLGVVLWQGGLIALDHYVGLGRSWGPSPRTDQTIGAGVLWIFGDVVGLPFLMALLHRFNVDDRARAVDADSQLADTTGSGPGDDSAMPAAPDRGSDSGLWWQQDPQLRERYRLTDDSDT